MLAALFGADTKIRCALACECGELLVIRDTLVHQCCMGRWEHGPDQQRALAAWLGQYLSMDGGGWYRFWQHHIPISAS